MPDYTLDANAAKQADNFFSKIDQKGRYLGTLTRAEKVVSSQGTLGIDFSFKANDGATADYLTIWTHKASGEQLRGFNAVMALMTCLRVKDLTAENGEVEKYDSDVKQRVKVNVPLFKALMNKPVGLLIHMEEYEKNAGGTAWKPVISAPFDKDGFTASEILSKAQKPEMLVKMEQALRDRPLKASAAPSGGNSSAMPGAAADFMEEIPF